MRLGLFVAVHGTGTPLGDPIETGAAAAALMGAPGRSQPLLLASAKSLAGHAEPAAGTVGLISLVAALASCQRQPVLHLRMLNPLVASALGAASGVHGAGSAVSRAMGPTPVSNMASAGAEYHPLCCTSLLLSGATGAQCRRDSLCWLLEPWLSGSGAWLLDPQPLQ